MSKFEGVDFATLPVQRLSVAAPPSAAGFRPLRGEFSTYFKKRVVRECSCHLSGCWYLSHESSLAGYITLLADRLSVDSSLLVEEGVKYKTFPAIKIGLLAADQRAKGAGKALIKWAFQHIATELCPRFGARYVTVDALWDPDTGYDVAPYYERFGFIHAENNDAQPTREQPFRTMFFDLKPLLEAIAEQ